MRGVRSLRASGSEGREGGERRGRGGIPMLCVMYQEHLTHHFSHPCALFIRWITALCLLSCFKYRYSVVSL